MNIGKALGADNILDEALKSHIEPTANTLHVLFRKVWEEEQVQIDWKEGHLIKILEKKDLSKYENYRGTTLLSVPGKVFNKVLLSRMEDAVDDRIPDQQVGFRKNRLCTDQIATLRGIVEQSIEWNSSLCTNFLYYEKVFDSMDKRIL
ncbi:unnamed protein product [Schistosoma curassoni]|uniref:Reverse transcriptase domain-containing protein n=1 Tax=Schistosoma curassoni TaxID=6186 RepID=A0A183KGX7_9TREM|nr:unnamed protein product [Schistosoma curassoni]